jgi:hypothetical protein
MDDKTHAPWLARKTDGGTNVAVLSSGRDLLSFTDLPPWGNFSLYFAAITTAVARGVIFCALFLRRPICLPGRYFSIPGASSSLFPRWRIIGPGFAESFAFLRGFTCPSPPPPKND